MADVSSSEEAHAGDVLPVGRGVADRSPEPAREENPIPVAAPRRARIAQAPNK